MQRNVQLVDARTADGEVAAVPVDDVAVGVQPARLDTAESEADARGVGGKLMQEDGGTCER
jgi:hypothetical protein